MTEVQMLVIAGAFIVAGIAKGAIGIGLPPIAIGLMTLAIPLEDSLAIMTIPTLITNVWQAVYGGGFWRLFRRFWTLAVPAVAALLLVAATLGQLGSARATAWLGVMLAAYSVVALLAWRPKVSIETERWANPLIGISSGAIAGVTGISAVPFLPYMQSLDINKNDLVQALGIMFIFLVGALSLALFRQGAFDATNTIGGFAAVIPTSIGVWIGQKSREALSPEMFRRIFLVGLLGIGLHMTRGLL
ncbi:MAG: hypothetical protein ABS35_26790 [Kaistia sp. SCN 65-12]|nr:MAG: hypothetical protein ABS35_26790 [Kaistia sp. SCN 65-12]